MMGTRRVRSVPRINSANSKPFISGIWTSTNARATSWIKSNSSAALPERASRSSRLSRLSRPLKAMRLASRSSTSRNFTGLVAIGCDEVLEWRKERGDFVDGELTSVRTNGEGGFGHDRGFGGGRVLHQREPARS